MNFNFSICNISVYFKVLWHLLRGDQLEIATSLDFISDRKLRLKMINNKQRDEIKVAGCWLFMSQLLLLN